MRSILDPTILVAVIVLDQDWEEKERFATNVMEWGTIITARYTIAQRAMQLAVSPQLLPNQPTSKHTTILIIPTKLTKRIRKVSNN